MWIERFDFTVFFCWLGLGLVGLVAIFSATQGPMHIDTHIASNFPRQVIHVALGLALVVLIQFASPQTFQNLAWLLYGVTLIFGILTIIFGVEVGGERNWLNLYGFRLQISEFMKTATILVLAAYLSMNRKASANQFSTVFIILVIVGLPVGLITLMGDTGTSLIFIGLIPFILFLSGLPYGLTLMLAAPAVLAYLSVVYWPAAAVAALVITFIFFLLEKKPFLTILSFLFCVAVVIGVQLALTEVLQPHQKARVEAFVNPAADPHGAGWNVIQAKTAIGSGGLTGKGFMQGTQTQMRFLPEQQTDFIFCVVSEEFGLLGASTVLLLFIVLLSKLLFIARTHKHPFAQIAVFGFVVIFFIHIVLNLGSALALLPVIGVPLPLISYGGSSFLNFSIMIGMALNFHLHERDFSIYA